MQASAPPQNSIIFRILYAPPNHHAGVCVGVCVCELLGVGCGMWVCVCGGGGADAKSGPKNFCLYQKFSGIN